MYIEQIFTGCLAEMTYFIESEGEAAIIDPLREIEPYLEIAKAHQAKIKYIFLTHFHADFVSGQVDLAKATGASIVFGPNARPNYPFHSAQDNELFKLGKIEVQLLHTPGHTLESSSYLIIDEQGKMPYVCTGDTLFIGDVGRPDLAVKSNLTKEDLAGYLFDSLRNKLMKLPNDIIIYPAHGAGSACGKNMSSETFDTLGNQKVTNYALSETLSKEEFIKQVLSGIKSPPQYFPFNVQKNKSINRSVTEIINNGTQAIDIKRFEKLITEENVLILDTRKAVHYIKTGSIRNALWIGLEGSFAPWVGALVKNINQKIVFICDESKETEVVTRLSRVGYDHTIGYLKGGIESWLNEGNEVLKFESISSHAFEDIYSDKNPFVLDVRKEGEYENQHVLEAKNFPLDQLYSQEKGLEKNEPYYIYCAGGYRSVIASSILRSKGFKSIINIEGGFEKIKKTNINITKFSCSNIII